MDFKKEIQQGIELQNQQQFAAARDLYKKILQQEPQQHKVLHLLGILENNLGNQQLAIQYINQAIAIDPTKPTYHKHLGIISHDLGLNHDATNSLKKAIELKPEDSESLRYLGSTYYKQGMLEESYQCYQKSCKIKPNDSEIYYRLSIVLQKLEKHKHWHWQDVG